MLCATPKLNTFKMFPAHRNPWLPTFDLENALYLPFHCEFSCRWIHFDPTLHLRVHRHTVRNGIIYMNHDTLCDAFHRRRIIGVMPMYWHLNLLEPVRFGMLLAALLRMRAPGNKPCGYLILSPHVEFDE